ncbi:hypothetical protein BDB00DRAFT_788228 [Zychaea mexicana]|uniref:uncharacterized protein n=1 Tax=Zychaea mexicana TaxID=64656 RepID=UPI0022FEBD45|nr:uncharacterized protein BDB00DRAFT_788228 [Zychaea mexicana]KAI9493185.1 hypothetical protein BDB00DRAFT_788228 [Zychaea mexicana]
MVPGVTLDPEVEKWEVNGVVVSELLLKYREESIKKGEKQVLDIYQEELSLNGIFLFDDLNCVYPDCSSVYGFDRDTWQAVMNECKELYPAQSLSKKTKKIIKKFAEAGAENFDKCDKIVEKLNNKDQIRESLRNITDGKASRKEKETNHKKGYVFPDLSMNFECGAMPMQRLLIAEIKPPHKVRTGSRPDLIKLALQMKDSIDKMINDGVDDPEITVSGLLIEGFRCTLFVMDLKYQKIYRFIPLQVFYIPRDRHDFGVLLHSFKALSTMERMVSENAELCLQFLRNKKRMSIRSSYITEPCIPKSSEAVQTPEIDQ